MWGKTQQMGVIKAEWISKRLQLWTVFYLVLRNTSQLPIERNVMCDFRRIVQTICDDQPGAWTRSKSRKNHPCKRPLFSGVLSLRIAFCILVKLFPMESTMSTFLDPSKNSFLPLHKSQKKTQFFFTRQCSISVMQPMVQKIEGIVYEVLSHPHSASLSSILHHSSNITKVSYW